MTYMKNVWMGTLIAIAGIGGATTAAAAETVPLLPTACEEALALSALPARLRAEATTYVLEANGFRKTREGTGPFTCLVTRNHPDSLIPLCFDRAGTETIVPSEIRRGEMIQAGKTNDDFNAERTRGAKDGTVKAPAPGVSYMTSDYNYIYNADAGQIVKVPAHMMYYAPYLTDKDIGGSEEDGMRNPGLPFINDQGVHGMMISMLNEASDSSEVEQHCTGQLPPPPGNNQAAP